MPNKALMLGVSIGVAGLLLLLTVLFGGPGSGGDDAPDISVNLDEIHVPSSNTSEILPLGEAEGIVYELKESGIIFFANRIVPRAEGEIDVIDTIIRIHFAPGRELTIEADEGTIVAPDNHPQEGQMRGNVIVTLFETSDGSEVDFDTDRDVVLRMYFDEPVDFDLELQQIESAGRIFLTGPQVQFRGRSLTLNYNQLRQRIERLVIEEGQLLRYIPEPVATAAPDRGSGEPKQARKPRPDRDTSTQDDASDQVAVENVKADRPVQYYLATFEALDDVRVGQDQYIVEGDDLSAVFSAKSAGDLEEPDTPNASPSSRIEAPAYSRMLASADPMSAALAYVLSASIGQTPEKDARSLATFTDDDVIITWAGRLVVTPLSDEDVPEALAGPDDVMVTVRGTPASIRTDKGETLLASKHAFFGKNASLLSVGTAESPVSIDAPDLGTLTGIELSIDQTLGTGYVLGPGTLTGQIRDKKGDKQASSAFSSETRNSKPDTREIAVSFDERLNLAFHLKQDDAPKQESNKPVNDGRIKGVKTADFLGSIRVDYAELDMTTDRLTLELLEDAPEGDDKLAVESLSATGNVVALVKEEDVKVYADRLLAHPATNQIELFGTPEAPARVVRPDATLVGGHLVMDDKAGTVTVPGPGTFDFIPDLNEPDKTVHVTWVTRMNYDDTAGTAQFLGDVKTLSIDGTDTNELMGEKLDLVFVTDESAEDTTTDKAGPTAGRRLATATVDGKVRFRARSYATIQRQLLHTELYLVGPRMVFTDPGTVPADDPQETLKQVQVIGVGRMLITDTRPKDEAAPGDYEAKDDSIDIAGQGKTAFEWSDRLILDLTNGEMLMKGAVVMVHVPAPGSSGDKVQLDCQDLAAEIQKADTSKKGVKKSGDGWLSDEAPKPELNRVWADGGIRIISGDITVTSDHLLYEEAKREIILWSDDPNVVVYQVQGEPAPSKSSAFRWNRDTGRVEAFRLRSGTIPLRRSERDRD